MAWKNPLKRMARKFGGHLVLKCKRCGSCCPKDCDYLSFDAKSNKSKCSQNKKVQANEEDMCNNPPERQAKFLTPFLGGYLSADGKEVFNCKASQELVDKVFGKGKYDLGRVFSIRNKVDPDFIYFAPSVSALLNAKTKGEYENARAYLELALSKARIK